MTLRSALHANAIFTGVCGLVCLLSADFVAAHTAMPDRLWIIGLGVMLLSFVPMLLFASWRPMEWLVRLIILLDWGYVATALAYFLFNLGEVDSIGALLIILTAALVVLFAILQQRSCAAARQA
ncbi:MAG: hypothetical protein ABL928_10060 [Sphingorhabdus sp.]